MQATSPVVRVWYDVVDSRETLKKFDEEGGFEQTEHRTTVRAHHALVENRGFFAFVLVACSVKTVHLLLLILATRRRRHFSTS